MLMCIYHPTNPMRVVESEEAEPLLESGFWFDSPAKARLYRQKIEDEINLEAKRPKSPGRPKKEKLNER